MYEHLSFECVLFGFIQHCIAWVLGKSWIRRWLSHGYEQDIYNELYHLRMYLVHQNRMGVGIARDIEEIHRIYGFDVYFSYLWPASHGMLFLSFYRCRLSMPPPCVSVQCDVRMSMINCLYQHGTTVAVHR